MGRRYNDYNAYLKALFGERVQKIIVDTGLGCPNRDGTIGRGGCIYCNSKGSGSGLWQRGFSITEQIEVGRKAMIRRYKARKFQAYFQSYTNTYTSCEHMKNMYDEALAAQGMVGIAVGTRPDCVDPDKIAVLASYVNDYLVWVEYGLQSVHDETLSRINRGHDFACFAQATQMTREAVINVCAHIILGLPGEDKAMMLETARKIGDLGIDGVKLHLLYVVKGTPLETMWKAGQYQCLDQQEYVDIVCDFLALLPGNVIVQRITGDPHPDELAAPQWALDRTATFKMIHESLEKRNLWQGKALGKNTGEWSFTGT